MKFWMLILMADQTDKSKMQTRSKGQKRKLVDAGKPQNNSNQLKKQSANAAKSKTMKKVTEKVSVDKVQKGNEQPQPQDSSKGDKDPVAFIDDDNYVSMEASRQLSDNFPSDNEEGEISDESVQASSSATFAQSQSTQSTRWGTSPDGNSSTDQTSESSSSADSSSEDMTPTLVKRNKRTTKTVGKTRHRSETPTGRPDTGTKKSTEKMEDTILMMQNFMIQQGILKSNMKPDELCEFIQNSEGCQGHRNSNDNHSSRSRNEPEQQHAKVKGNRNRGNALAKKGGDLMLPSEVTIYQNAVEMQGDQDRDTSTSSMDDPIDMSGESAAKLNDRLLSFDKAINCDSNFTDSRHHRSTSRSRSPRKTEQRNERRRRSRSRSRS